VATVPIEAAVRGSGEKRAVPRDTEAQARDFQEDLMASEPRGRGATPRPKRREESALWSGPSGRADRRETRRPTACDRTHCRTRGPSFLGKCGIYGSGGPGFESRDPRAISSAGDSKAVEGGVTRSDDRRGWRATRSRFEVS